MKTSPDHLHTILDDPGTATLGILTAKRREYLDACHDALLAHEMLAALELSVMVMEMYRLHHTSVHHKVLDRARNAIRKAKGE